MSDGLGIFDEPAKKGRYAARNPPRPWTPQEDLVLFPVLLACHSERAYVAACRFLCRTLNREPAFPSGAKPTESQIAASCISIVERRTVTELMTKWYTGFAPDCFGTLAVRSGEPASWAELARFVRPYQTKRTAGTSAVKPADFLTLLERDEDDQQWFDNVAGVIDTVRIEEDLGAVSPTDPRNVVELAAAVRVYVGIPANDPVELTRAWTELHEVLYP